LKKKIDIALLAVLITGFFATTALAAGNWEMSISVSSGNAGNRLSFGQHQDATDQRDGLYDVPAMLSGTLQTWFSSVDTPLWRDIRSSTPENSSEWSLLISSRTGLPVVVSWDSQQLPPGSILELSDSATGTVVDMGSANSYLLEDSSKAELMIKFN